MMYYYHSYYYYYILLPILLYIRKSVHQKCMIILWYYIQNWQLLERVVQVKMVKNFCFFVFFLRKKRWAFVFWWLYVIFLSVFLIFGQKSATYDWFLSLLCWENFLFASNTSFVCETNWKKNTYYLLILVNMNYCLSLWFKLTTEKNVCLNENKTKIKNNNAYIKEHFEMSIEKKTRFLTIMLITN